MTTTQQQEEELHICGQTGREFDQENPVKGCGETIEEDDENVMIGNISYCLACAEKSDGTGKMEQYDRYVLWTSKYMQITIHESNYYGDDMLESMYELLMGGGIDGVYISAVEGGDNCNNKIKTEKTISNIVGLTLMELTKSLRGGWTDDKMVIGRIIYLDNLLE